MPKTLILTTDPLRIAFFGFVLLLSACAGTRNGTVPGTAEAERLSAGKLARIAEEQRRNGNHDAGAQAYRQALFNEIVSGGASKDGLSPRAQELLLEYERAVLRVSAESYPSTDGWSSDILVEDVVSGYPEDTLPEKPMDMGLLLDGIDLPVVLNERVWREIRYFTEIVPGFTERSLGRKAAYDSLVSSALDSAGLPSSLAWLAFVESGYVVSALSSAKANGIWQFMPATARHYGLAVDWWVDERRDPEKSTRAALRYLSFLYREFGDWLLAMAAYNCGEGRVRRALREQEVSSFWELELPEETMHYVPRILAAAIIGRQPDHWGFAPEPQRVAPSDTFTVAHPVPLATVAELAGVHEDSVQVRNPSLVRWTTPPSRKSYLLRLPEGTRERFAKGYAKLDKSKLVRWQHHKVKSGENLSVIAFRYGVTVSALQSANRLSNSRLRVGQDLMIPDPSAAKGAAPAPRAAAPRSSGSAPGRVVTVRAGDSYYSIARAYGCTVDELKRANGAGDNNLRVGQKLKLPAAAGAGSGQSNVYTVRKGDNLYSIAKSLGVSLNDLLEWNGLDSSSPIRPNDKLTWFPGRKGGAAPAKAPAARPAPAKEGAKGTQEKAPAAAKSGKANDIWYTVRSGDTLWDISRRNNTTVDRLMEWNPGAKGGIKPGDRLKVGEK